MVNTKKYSTGFTLIELMVAMTMGLFMSLTMVGYFADSLKSAAVLRSEKQIGESAQRVLSVISDAVHEAGSGNPALSDVPFYVGSCGGWDPCTDDGSANASDRIAVLVYPENRRSCGNTATAAGEQIANVYFIDLDSGVNTLFCRGYSLQSLAWLEARVALVHGVENLQILYRVNDASAGTSSYLSADNVPSVDGVQELGWDRVRAADIHVLISNGLGNTTPDTPASQSFKLADTDTQVFTDGVLRKAFSTQSLIFSKME